MNKNRILKIILAGMLILSILATMLPVAVSAATFSVSSNKSSVSPNGTFTVSVSVPGAGQFSISGSNATVSSSSIWCEDSCSVTATAGKSGTASVTVSAIDATGYDETAVTGSKTVSVKINTPSTNTGSSGSTTSKPNGGTTQTQPTYTKSSVNTLKSLTISEGELSPKFNPDTTSYTVDLKGNNIKFKIDAVKTDNKSTMSGTGEFELVTGENKFEIKVTAENGNPKIYKLTVNVKEVPVAHTTFEGEEYGLISLPADVKAMEGFEETKIDFNGVELKGLFNSFKEITLVHTVDKENNLAYFIWDVNNNKIISKYEQMALSGCNIALITIPNDKQDMEGFVFEEITVDGKKIMGWSFKDSNFINYKLFYAMDESGQARLYQYEETTNTIQPYSNAAPISIGSYNSMTNQVEESKVILERLYISIGVLSFLIVVVFILLILNKAKYKKLVKEFNNKDNHQEVKIGG